MRKKFGVALLCILVSAVLYAASQGDFNSMANAVANDFSAMSASLSMSTMTATVAPDQTVVSLTGELPAHDPTVGKLAGSAGTSGGAATYSIPIALPPGRRGMQPSLSLDYSSRAGNSIAGMGWSLSGLSSLHRCPATIEQDGMVGAVSLTNADKLCLDGQRLIPTVGVYGQLNTVYDTEIESFVRVTQLGGDLQSASTYFEVETKSGEILWYGNNSTAANSARVVPGGVTVPLSWMLVRREDHVGNFMRYAYTNYGNGEVLLSDIFYTGFGTTDGDRDINFSYQARPTGTAGNDQSSSYLAGGLTVQTQRLAAVTTWSGVSSNPNNEVRQYLLNYGAPSQSTHRSLLTSVQECAFQAGQSACRRPTTFGWQQGPIQTMFHPALTPDGYTFVRELPDFSGDGTPKMLATDANNYSYILTFKADRTLQSAINVAGFTNTNFTSVYGTDQSADFDGDGRADLIGVDSNNNVVIYFWDGPATATTFAQAFTRQWTTSVNALNPGWTVPTAIGQVGDMDGDGRADLVKFAVYPGNPNNCRAKLEVYRNIPNTSNPSLMGQFQAPTNAPCLAATPVWNPSLAAYDYYYETPNLAKDLNGDGLPDFIVKQSDPAAHGSPGRILYGTRSPTYGLTSASYSSLFPGDLASDEADGRATLFWLDINGDGLPDYMVARQSGWSMRINSGHGLSARIDTTNKNGIESCGSSQVPMIPSCSQVWQPWMGGRIEVADVDGDGRQELLIPRNFAAAICNYFVDKKTNPLEPDVYYECPEGSDYSNINANGWNVHDMYADGQGRYDQSAYFMSSVRLVQTWANQFQFIEEPTSRISAHNHVAADIYGDGLEDSLTRVGCPWAGVRACALALGPTTPTTLPGGYPMDAKGNATGTNGMFMNENRGPNGTLNPDGKTPELPDLMSMVTDGVGAQTVWTYYPLSSGAGRAAGQTPLYTVPTDPASKYVDDRHIYFTSSMPVVSDMATSDGIGGYRALRYGYSQAMYNEQGRGFQGFRSITEEDTTAGLRTTTIFNQKFPLASQVQEVIVNALTRSGTAAPIKDEVYTWRCNRANRNDTTACTPPSGNATIKFPYLDKKETWTFDGAVAALPTGTPQPIGYSQDVNADDSTCAGSFAAASGFDANGNLTAHTVLSSDSGAGTVGFRPFVSLQCQRTRSSYTANTVTWWLDRLDSTISTSAITYNTTNHALPTGVTNPAQTVATTYLWNADRTLQQQTVQTGVANQQKVTSYVYPGANNYGLPSAVAVAASGDANVTRSSSIGYSGDGYFPSITTNPLGQQTQVTTSPRDGQPTLAIDANGLRTLMSYDVFGQLIRTQFHGTSDAIQAAPDKLFARSWCSGTCLPGPQALYKTTDVQDGTPTRIVSYDLLGRTVLSATWAWDNTLPLILTQFNALGQVAAQSNPYDNTPQHLFWTTFQYDLLGRVTQKIVPKGADDGRGNLKTTYTYSGGQTAIQVCGSADLNTTNCLNMTRTTDSMGKYMETVDARGGITQYWTDATGNTLALVDAKGSITRAAYNPIGQRSSVADPNQGTWTFVYDALGEVLSQTDARGIVTNSSYDKLGRPLARNATIDVTGDNMADSVADSWAYDPLYAIGAPATSQRLVNGAIERKQVYTYDTLARRIQTDTTQQIATGTTKAYTQTVAYDGYYGRPKSTGYPNGEAVATLYSKYGIPIRSFNPVDNAVYREVTAVDLAGNPTAATLGGGLLTDTRTYRIPTSELLQIKTSRSGTALRQLDYQTDVFGNLTKQTLNSGATVETYAYDTLQRMTQATRSGAVNTNISYAYDAVGNFTSKSDFSTNAINAYTYTGGVCGGGANAVKSVVTPGGTRTYCYDADGNLTTDSAGLAIKYDHDNLPFQTTRNASSINLAYGPDNQRTRQWGSDGTKVYVDGFEDWISAGSTKVYVGADAEITTTSTTRTVNYLLTDRLGSVDSIADSTGTLIETRGSDAFGKPRTGTWADTSPARLQSTAITAKGFTEHEHLNSVELIHMNGRVYDYALGRFLSVDPFIQFPLNSQSLNPYSYIMNNPLAGTDPTGYAAEGGTCDPNSGASVACGGAGAPKRPDRPDPGTGSRIAGHSDAEVVTSLHPGAHGGDQGNGGNGSHQSSSTPRAIPDKQPLPAINQETPEESRAWAAIHARENGSDPDVDDAKEMQDRIIDRPMDKGLGVVRQITAGLYWVAAQTPYLLGGGLKADAKVAEEAITTLRGADAAIPRVADSKLGNIISDLYKGAKSPNRIGTGSTADAIRNEVATGVATGGRFHAQKGMEYIRALEKWQVKNPDASFYDRIVAESLKNDLRSALGK
jgi:RHS repeat-associated protein